MLWWALRGERAEFLARVEPVLRRRPPDGRQYSATQIRLSDLRHSDLTVGSLGTIDFLVWFIPLVAVWLIWHGAASVWR